MHEHDPTAKLSGRRPKSLAVGSCSCMMRHAKSQDLHAGRQAQAPAYLHADLRDLHAQASMLACAVTNRLWGWGGFHPPHPGAAAGRAGGPCPLPCSSSSWVRRGILTHPFAQYHVWMWILISSELAKRISIFPSYTWYWACSVMTPQLSFAQLRVHATILHACDCTHMCVGVGVSVCACACTILQ